MDKNPGGPPEEETTTTQLTPPTNGGYDANAGSADDDGDGWSVPWQIYVSRGLSNWGDR